MSTESSAAPPDVVLGTLRSDSMAPPRRAVDVDRPELIDLMNSFIGSTILLSAPAGYGKTTLAAQWCAEQARPIVWRTIRSSDNDPIALATSVLAGLHAIEPLDQAGLAALSGPAGRLDSVLLPTLSRCLADRDPLAIVIDDAHTLSAPAAIGVLVQIVRSLGAGSQIVFTCRNTPDVGLAKLRARGDLLEIHSDQLAMDRATTARLLDHVGALTDDDAVDRVHARTEGWAAGVALHGLAATRAQPVEIPGLLTGRHRDIADYFVDEVLSHQPADVCAFLYRSATLNRLSAEICDAALGRDDAAGMLAELERNNLFIVPLDDERRWYRYHHLFQDLLVDRLRRTEPSLEAGILQRAASWYRAHGNVEDAVDCARRGGDDELVGEILLENMERYAGRGQLETYRIWLEQLDDSTICRVPATAIAAAHTYLRGGDADRARRYVTEAGHGDLDRPSADGATSLRSSWLVARNTVGLTDVAEMLRDGRELDERERPTRSRWLVGACRIVGNAELALGHPDRSIPAFEEALALIAERPDLQYRQPYCASYLMLANIEAGRWSAAEELWDVHHASIAEERAKGLTESVPTYLAEAALCQRQRDHHAVGAALNEFEARLRMIATSPIVVADMAIRGVEVALAAGLADLAQRFAAVADRCLAKLDNAGVMSARLADLRGRMVVSDQLSSLTPAEMRVLEQLATHRTLEEIGAALFVSRSTIKTHVSSVYSKLAVSGRNEAVELLNSRAAARHAML